MENQPSALPDKRSEDLASIIRADSSRENPSAFQRYAVPPQFEGNSSDEDEPNVLREEKEDRPNGEDETNEAVDEDSSEGGYQALVTDEFGEFVSSETFGDYYSQEDDDPDFLCSSRSVQDTANVGQMEELKISEAIPMPPTPPAAVPNTTVQRVSIPPLDAGEHTTCC